MLAEIRTFFDHSRHKLQVLDLDAVLDVLAFSGEESLSQPFAYDVEFTATQRDLPADQLLGRDAHFSLYPPPTPVPVAGLSVPPTQPLRTLHGVVTGFRRLSGSNDEARYAITLQPRLALLGRGRQYRIYQHLSVPEIVEQILRSDRHHWSGQDFVFDLKREYPKREQVMQYGESDLAFIQRLLAEVGIWYRFTADERLGIEVVEFHDDQRNYQFGVQLPYRPQSGTSSTGQDAVWQLQSQHGVVEKNLRIRAYTPRDAAAYLDGELDQTRGDPTTYGEAYHYGEPYTELDDPHARDEDLKSESGYFYARLAHERYLNGQTRLEGRTSSAALAPGQVLKIDGGAPEAFVPGAVITRLVITAARDRSFEARFTAIPYTEHVCFRPSLLAKPVIAGTIPARVTSPQPDDLYSHIDLEGRYKVNFLFDQDTWPAGQESMWLRLARPYAGDTYGLHLPLIQGTQVGIAFEHGDPDRGFIAFALHDSRRPDLVTLKNYKRNVLRTPANNKLRLDDTRGQEHIKLSTEHSGKSQLNLGRLVDGQRQTRGKGFELRTDAWGAIRAGKGVFISADEQARAQGQVLAMGEAIARLQEAGEQMQALSDHAQAANADPADVPAQLAFMREQLDQLQAAVALLSAPQGIALTSGEHLQLAAQRNLMLNAGHAAAISVVKRLFIGVGEGVSLFVRKLGLKLIANQGPVQIQAQNDRLELLARHGLDITSTEDEIRISAKQKITLNAGGSYITLDPYGIESGTQGEHLIKAVHFDYQQTKAPQVRSLPVLPLEVQPPLRFDEQFQLFADDGERVLAAMPYKITGASGRTWRGVTDSQGFTQRVYTARPEALSVTYGEELEEEEEEEELPDGIVLRLGLFFDGTGNNLANAAAVAQCQREDLNQFSEDELATIIQQCEGYGYTGLDGGSFTGAPDNSYGNAPSNVAHLFRLYPDNVAVPVTADADIGYVPVYLEGIGTRSGGKDSLYGQGFGRGETGVVARVEQAPAIIEAQLDAFTQANPGIRVRAVEFDLFGFSRGAAAARHCANEFLKPGLGLFGELLQAGRWGLIPGFDPSVNVTLNLIGLFDSVAGIVSLAHGDLSAGNASNPDVNLFLPAGCARKVIQLCARDEYRHNFALNSVETGHEEISLPGVHSDIGGGYLPRGRERLLLTQPRRMILTRRQAPTEHPLWQQARAQVNALLANGLAGDGDIEITTWPITMPPRGDHDSQERHFLVAAVLDRPVRGELALIGLRVMRELGVRHGVPFKPLPDERRFKLPDDLQAIAAITLELALAGLEVQLGPEQERLLRGHYIHQSAHWTPSSGLLVNKPAENATRNVFPNQPHKDYPV